MSFHVIKLKINITFLILLLLGLFLANFSFATISLKSTLSGSYFRDLKENIHSSVFFDVEFDHTSKKGIDTYLEVSLDNNFVQDVWAVYPYQAYISIPFSNGFENRPFHKSRIMLGRQLLIEGFEMELMDGIYFPYYFSLNKKLLLYVGRVHIPEELTLEMEEQILGGSFLFNKWNTNFKLGLINKQYKDDDKSLSYLSIMKSWENALFHPMAMVKYDWNFTDDKNEQSQAELQFLVSDSFNFTLSHACKNPTILSSLKKDEIYRMALSAESRQESSGFNFNYMIHDNLNMLGSVEKVSFESPKQIEKGYKGNFSLLVDFLNSEINPSITYFESYGGKALDMGIDYRYNVSDKLSLQLKTYATHVDKITGIKGWAYYCRSTFDWNFKPHWVTMMGFEMERNYVFDFDLRAVFYLSQFYF